MNDKVELFKLSFTVFDKILLLKSYDNKDEIVDVFDNAIIIMKDEKIKNAELLKAYEIARSRIISLSFEQIKEYIDLIK